MSLLHRAIAAACAAALLSLSAACQLPAPSGPRLVGEGRRALFIGNSYLYAEDIPGIVQALAAALAASPPRWAAGGTTTRLPPAGSSE